MKQKDYPIVIITWLDHTGTSAWKTLDEVKSTVHVTCKTIGWLVHEDKNVVKVYDSMTDDGGFGGESIIHKKLMVSKEEVVFDKK